MPVLLLLLMLLLRLLFGLSVWASHRIRVPGQQPYTSHNIVWLGAGALTDFTTH